MSANKVNYFEIGTTNPEETQRFYSQLFGWQCGPTSPANYRMVNETEGGMLDTTAIGGSGYAIFYVQFDDVASAIERAEKLGAKVLVPLTSNPAIEFAHLADVNGNRFGIWKPKATQ